MNKQALIDLRDEIKSGGCPEVSKIIAALRPFYSGDEPVVFYVKLICGPRDLRALGAAEALHKALLPGWDIQIVTYEDDTFEASVARPLKCKTFDGVATSMARAWLIAILEALIAEAE